MPISININVDRIDKSRLIDGKKGRYLDIILWETKGESEEYGDYIVKQRGEKGDKMPILGNGKYYEPRGQKGEKSERHERRSNNDIF